VNQTFTVCIIKDDRVSSAVHVQGTEDIENRYRDLQEVGEKLLKDGAFRVEDSPRRVRILLNSRYIVDTTSAKYVWEHSYYPQ
jgi:hypothetical protein